MSSGVSKMHQSVQQFLHESVTDRQRDFRIYNINIDRGLTQDNKVTVVVKLPLIGPITQELREKLKNQGILLLSIFK